MAIRATGAVGDYDVLKLPETPKVVEAPGAQASDPPGGLIGLR